MRSRGLVHTRASQELSRLLINDVHLHSRIPVPSFLESLAQALIFKTRSLITRDLATMCLCRIFCFTFLPHLCNVVTEANG